MSVQKQKENKFKAFKPAQLSDWEMAAREELKGANPWEQLQFNIAGCPILPYYERNEAIITPALTISENNFLGARAWYNCPRLLAEDPKIANEKALEWLRQGADGIFFELEGPTDFKELLKDIEWQYCSLNFLAKKNQESVATALQHFFNGKKVSGKQLPGAFFGNTRPNTLIHSPFRFAGFHLKPLDSPVEEIANGFLEMARALGNALPESAGQVAFHITMGTNFFMEIAKLRALRGIWTKFLQEKKSKINSPLFILAHSPCWSNKDYQPHENMLKGTTSAISAVLGGCDALCIEEEDPDNAMMIRAARNISNVLREESYLSKVADPMAGSYFIENLTHQLTDAVWKSIQPDLKS